jgi:hypothetical protein
MRARYPRCLTLALPGWFPLLNAGDAHAMTEILGEHMRVLRMLNDEHSDEMGMLIAYRRFLQARGAPALATLLEFMAVYGSTLPSAWQRGHRLPAFQRQNLRRLIMALEPDLGAVLDNPGFIAIADAIRRCTVSAQAQRTMKGKDYRDIRYDLLPPSPIS